MKADVTPGPGLTNGIIVWSAGRGRVKRLVQHPMTAAGRSWNAPDHAFHPEFRGSGSPSLITGKQKHLHMTDQQSLRCSSLNEE
ncbi:hypothetical protein [Streptomyces chiangmaiensis]|uniref:Uncharacterized protein n=1 Tax=Streptomyces chiangmaiensis TaxID=766497 RepID=A0ABU7FX17_9ACTN|nr:hypothetical protein [Streptomyces chiangmaiensis]MED7828484.1 hypothetical protein [Streptomyces chiangmaiensis]